MRKKRDKMEQKQPSISFIVPVYNTEKYLRKCLDSLVNQTRKDFEIIVVNDGSTDDSQLIIEEYKRNYPEIRSFVKQNGGLSDARNFGLQYAVGEYVAFVDSDDYVSKELVEKTIEAAKDQDSDIVCFRIFQVSNGLPKPQQNRYFDTLSGQCVTVKRNPKSLIAAKPYAWNKIFRRSLFFENEIYFPVGQKFEDSATTYNLLLVSNQIHFLNEYLYYYITTRPESITNSIDDGFYDIFKSIDSIFSFYKANKAYSYCEEVLGEIARMLIFARLNKILQSSDIEFSLRYIDNAYKKLNTVAPQWYKSELYWLKRVKFFKKRKIQYYIKRYSFLYKRYYLWYRNKKASRNCSCTLTNDQHSLLQKIQIEMLKTIDLICRENNISYYLAEGSLLGGIRHSGFIPWDDDIDIMMLRDDYQRFISIFKGEIDNCILLNEKTYSGYYLPFSKVVTTKPRGFVNQLDIFPIEYSGPSIDIFPIDTVSSAVSQRRFRKIRIARDILLYKSNYLKPFQIKSRYRRLFYLIRNFVSYKKLHNYIYRLSTLENKKVPKYYVNFASSYNPKKETFPIAWFDGSRTVIFEGMEAPVPVEAEKVLSVIYGDWNILPPINKRIQRHSLNYVDN